MPTRREVNAYFRQAWHECTEGSIKVPDPKHPGKLNTVAWVVVNDLMDVIQKTLTNLANAGLLRWHANMPPDEIWFQIILDKGGTTTKAVMKVINSEQSDSVLHCVVLGMMDGCKDTYENIQRAFGTLIHQANEINRKGFCMGTVWRQVLPHGFETATDDAEPMVAAPARADTAKQGGSCKKRAKRDVGHAASPSPLVPPLVVASDERRPDCYACADGHCPCASREAKTSSTGGPWWAKRSHDIPRLRAMGCTFSETCSTCNRLKDGTQLECLRRQWEAARKVGLNVQPRRLRIFWGGDWMSQSEPLGLQGPNSKCFCWACLGSLHETNRAGQVHRPKMPPGEHEFREPHHANPQPRSGSAAIDDKARKLRKAGPAGKPIDHDSVVHPSLIWIFGNPVHSHSTTPLHLNLGIGQFFLKAIEAELEEYDMQIAEGEDRPVSPALMAKLRELQQKILSLHSRIEEFETTISSHKNGMRTMEADATLAADVVAGMGRKRADEPPRAAEYRMHRMALKAAEHARSTSEKSLKDAKTKLKEIRDTTAGPHIRALNSLMQALDLERQAYHSGALVGNDVHKFLLPASIELFSQLVAPKVRVELNVRDDGQVRMSTNLDFLARSKLEEDALKVLEDEWQRDVKQAACKKVDAEDKLAAAPGPDYTQEQAVLDSTEKELKAAKTAAAARRKAEKDRREGRYLQFEAIMATFSQMSSLYSRKEPLCDHEILLYDKLCDDFAILFKELWPEKEPIPKMHMMLYHVIEQMRFLGSTGQLHEGVVEALHPIDNRHKARYANVKSLKQQVTARMRAALQLQHIGRPNIRGKARRRALRAQQKKNAANREARTGAWEAGRKRRYSAFFDSRAMPPAAARPAPAPVPAAQPLLPAQPPAATQPAAPAQHAPTPAASPAPAVHPPGANDPLPEAQPAAQLAAQPPPPAPLPAPVQPPPPVQLPPPVQPPPPAQPPPPPPPPAAQLPRATIRDGVRCSTLDSDTKAWMAELEKRLWTKLGREREGTPFEEYLEDEDERHPMFAHLAEVDGELAGFAIRGPKERAERGERGGKVFVYELHAAIAGRSIGRDLLDKCASESKAKTTFLQVHEDNGDAIRFYERVQFGYAMKDGQPVIITNGGARSSFLMRRPPAA